MNFSHKLLKLLDPDIISSLREHVHRAFHPINARGILEELEKDPAWEALRRKYPPGIKQMHRWADTKSWIRRNIERAQDLSLDRGPRRHILDLGCGPGYFLYVAKKLGHSGTGLDIDEHAIFRETLPLLGVKRIVHRIQPRFHLPAPEHKYDLITSYLTCFHRLKRLRDGNWQTWSADEWQFFIDDVRAHQLAKGGLLLLEFHPQKNGELYAPDVRELFVKNRARLFRSKVFLKN
jgi:SAM-dependent methyltransferase